MEISIIVAIAENYAIGKDNQLLWHISDDLKRFKQITSGNTIIMGKKTYYSLPVRPLKNRRNIVITDIAGETIDGCTMAYSIDEAVSLCEKDKENFVIGGGSIYAQFMKYATKLYITKVHKPFEGDVFFPEIDSNHWQLESNEPGPNDSNIDFNFSYLTYVRKK